MSSKQPFRHPSASSSESISSSWAVRLINDRRLLVLLIGIVVVAGLSSFAILPRMEDPILTKRVATIVTFLPGADAGRVESMVTEKLEDSLRDIESIKELRSTSRPGSSTIIIELLDQVKESDSIWSRVRSKIEDTLPQLPENATRPQMDELDVRAYAKIISLVWDHPGTLDYTTLRRVARRLQDKLQTLNGTEKVDMFSDPGEEVVVRVDTEKAAALGLSTEDIARQLLRQDAQSAAGQVRGSQIDLSLEVSNQFKDLAAVARADIQAADGRFVRVDSVADIRLEPPSPLPRLGRHGDKPAITLGVLVRQETRIDQWAVKADRLLEEHAKELPVGLKIEQVMDQSEYVNARLSTLFWNLVMGGLAVWVVILLLMGWRSAMIVSAALPLTVLAVLFGFRVLNIPIHQMSVTGLIIALGLLIDNAIVVTDEIQKELVRGVNQVQAIIDTVRKLAVPLIGSTLTTVFAFGPIALMPGPAGEFVSSIAYSVIMAVSASLFFSLTVIATLSAIFIRLPSQNSGGWRRFWTVGFSSQWLTANYRRVIGFSLQHPIITFLIWMIIPVLGFAVAPTLKEQFFPPADRDQFHIQVELGSGASIADTQAIAEKIDKVLAGEAVRQVDWFFGDSAPSFYYNIVATRKSQSQFGQAIVRIASDLNVTEVIRRVQEKLDRAVPEARALVRQLEQGPPFDAPVEVRIFGPDLEVLREKGEELRLLLSKVPDILHTSSLLDETLPQVRLTVDAQSASLAGLSPTEIANQVQASLDGRQGGSIIQEMEELPVRVRANDRSRNDLGGVRSLDLISRDQGGSPTVIPLRAVASTSLEPESGVIVRLDRRRMNEIAGYLTAGTLPAKALNEFQQRLEATGFKLPVGYELRYGGEASKRNDAVGNLMASVGVLMACMVATLVLSLGSFRLASIIGLVGLLSIGSGMFSLWLGNYPFGFMAIIGTMGLIGVAINDSIVVLISLKEQHGSDASNIEGMVDTVVDCTRHVIATTLTTVAGFTPLVISGGTFWPPLAVAISGGVLFATGIALFLVPVVYRAVYCRSATGANSRLESNTRSAEEICEPEQLSESRQRIQMPIEEPQVTRV
jgi:multidrug efflux pump subunit AcrB